MLMRHPLPVGRRRVRVRRPVRMHGRSLLPVPVGMQMREPLALRVHFLFKHTATTEIYTLSLHDALPISNALSPTTQSWAETTSNRLARRQVARRPRSEEHTSELQSLAYLVCRLLLEKKKKNRTKPELARDNSIEIDG